MAEKQIVLPISTKMILLEALRGYAALCERRVKAEKFEPVRKAQDEARLKVFEVLRMVEPQ